MVRGVADGAASFALQVLLPCWPQHLIDLGPHWKIPVDSLLEPSIPAVLFVSLQAGCRHRRCTFRTRGRRTACSRRATVALCSLVLSGPLGSLRRMPGVDRLLRAKVTIVRVSCASLPIVSGRFCGNFAGSSAPPIVEPPHQCGNHHDQDCHYRRAHEAERSSCHSHVH